MENSTDMEIKEAWEILFRLRREFQQRSRRTDLRACEQLMASIRAEWNRRGLTA